MNVICDRCGGVCREIHSDGYQEPPFYCSETCYANTWVSFDVIMKRFKKLMGRWALHKK